MNIANQILHFYCPVSESQPAVGCRFRPELAETEKKKPGLIMLIPLFFGLNWVALGSWCSVNTKLGWPPAGCCSMMCETLRCTPNFFRYLSTQAMYQDGNNRGQWPYLLVRRLVTKTALYIGRWEFISESGQCRIFAQANVWNRSKNFKPH